MKTRKIFFLTALLFACAFFTTGCFINQDVNADQVGVILERNEIVQIKGPGVYTNWGLFADLKTISVSTLTFSVEDPEVATADNQLVGIKITIQARRKNDDESVKNMFTNWSALVDNDVLKQTISATAAEGIKNGVRGFDLAGLLDDRNGLAQAIARELEADAGEYSVVIINVTIENISLSPEYTALMQDRANLTAQRDLEQKRQEIIKQQASNDQLEQEQRLAVLRAQLDAEKAKTAVELEIAQREGKLIDARNSVYKNNPYAYELERLRLLAAIFGDKSVFYFLPVGADLTLLFSPSGTILPIPK